MGTRDWRSTLFAAAVTAGVLGIGSLVLQRWVAETRGAAITMVVAWFVIVLVGLFIVLRDRPAVRMPALATYVAVLAGTIAIGYWTGFRETEVNEDVAVATSEASGAEREAALIGSGAEKVKDKPEGPVSLATGSVVGADGHSGSGKAEVVEDAGGKRVLTLTDLSVDPGPDVDVLLSTSSESVEDAVNLGDLKGSSGNQEYPIPADADLKTYSNVVLYCNPFTVRIAVAELDV
jgi:hypothetical protein